MIRNLLFLNDINKILYQLNRKIHLNIMANSRFEYVKKYETEDKILPNVWIVVRVDGKGFHKFSKAHDFDKPNDENALNLMNNAAIDVMQEYRDIILSYGQSDEYSFVFRKNTNVYNRRSEKLLSYVTSMFTSSYVYNWNSWFPNKKLVYPPCFDGRIVLYPSDQNLKDYLSWRQADVHINNLYNTAFWCLVLKSGLTNTQAESELRGTFSSDKNELLFTKFNINYNNINPMFRKGTVLLRKNINCGNEKRQIIIPYYEDIIKDNFWKNHSELLDKYSPGEYDLNTKLMNDKSNSELPVLIEKQLSKMQLNS